MKTLNVSALVSVCILSGCTARHELPAPVTSERLTGAWQLLSWESTVEGQSSFPFGKDAAGVLVYTATGRMFVFLSEPNRQRFTAAEAKAGTLPEKAAAFDSCFAYSGTYRVADNKVIHRIEHCTFPNWIGTEQVRYFRFDGDRVILETPPLPAGGGKAISRLVWERVPQ